VLQYQGEYEEAEVLHREALKRREKILGMDHPDTLTSVYNLAFVLHQMKRYDDSSELYQRASNAFEMALGQSHPATIACNNHYNSLKQEMSSNSNAIQPQQNVGS
jgi:tetratricopeptide (TPR) repeat protein